MVVIRLIVLFNILHQSFGLVALPNLKENDIMKTEAVIRNTVNGLLESLKTAPEKAPKLEQYLQIHNYFLSLSIKDYHNLKEIEKLSRILDKRNTTIVLMNTINDILNEYSSEQNNDKTQLVEDPHKQIDYFTENIDRLMAKYPVPYDEEKTDNFMKKNSLGERLNEILAPADNASNNKSHSGEIWVETSRRIFASQKARIRQYPFMAVIQIFGQFYCSGAILADDMVITAASCLQLAWNNRHFRENMAHVSVRIGSTFPSVGGEVIPVIEIFFNPNYNPSNLQGNLALLRLARHINFRLSKRVKKILFDHNPTQIPFSTAGVSLLGWGAKDVNNKLEFKIYLQHAKLDVVPLLECQEIYTKEYVRKDNMCVGFATKGGGACNHDIGDPGVVDNILMGIVSFASPVCGRVNSPTVLTKLGYHAEWIDEVLATHAPQIMTQSTTLPYDSPSRPKSEEETTSAYSPVLGEKRKSIPHHMAETLITYFDNDTNVYDSFIEKCNNKDVQDFARALKGHGLEIQISKRQEPKIVYLK